MDTSKHQLKTSFLKSTQCSAFLPKPPNARYSSVQKIWGQSASTWRHTSVFVSFSRADRFPAKKPDCAQIVELLSKSTRTKRSCSFGMGKKKPMDMWRQRCAADVPASNVYELSMDISKPSKGKSFGESRAAYELVYQPHKQQVYAQHFTKDYPSHIYQVSAVPGAGKRKTLIHRRLKMFNELAADNKRHIPGPIYQVRAEPESYERSQGKGERLDFSKPANNYPGAIYDIKGDFEKYAKF